MNTECWTCKRGEVICGDCKNVAEFIDTAVISCKDGHRIDPLGCSWYEEKGEK